MITSPDLQNYEREERRGEGRYTERGERKRESRLKGEEERERGGKYIKRVVWLYRLTSYNLISQSKHHYNFISLSTSVTATL